MRAIDMRLRPPYGCFLQMHLYEELEELEKIAVKRGISVSQAAMSHSMDALIREMDESGVEKGVVYVRRDNHGSNADVLSLINAYPGRFIGIAAIDPLDSRHALEEIETFVVNGGFRGVLIEGGHRFNRENYYITDQRLFPVYEYCQEKKIPVLLNFGGRNVIDQSYSNPVEADRLGFLFPDMIAVFCHGGWPYVSQMCHAAIQHPNFYISPDMWGMDFVPMHQGYFDAANWQLQDRMLFGSAFPSSSLADAVKRYSRNLRPEVLDKVMYENAANLFRLESPEMY